MLNLRSQAADAGDAWVVADFEDGAAHFVEGGELLFSLFGVGHHGAELVHGEGASIQAAAHAVRNTTGPGEVITDGEGGQEHEQARTATIETERAEGVDRPSLPTRLPGRLRAWSGKTIMGRP
ncbi:MAG: hypothetical protein V9G14_05670 [Cypionkella sp.]